MIIGCRTLLLAMAAFIALVPCRASALPGTTKQQSLDEWRNLTTPPAPPPRVFVKGDHVRFYFPTQNGIEAFNSHWTRFRVPTGRYRVSSAQLRWDQRLSRMPETERGWREATVIAGAEWRQLSTNLILALTPTTPGHGAYYQAFLSDRLLYRDQDGVPKVALATERPRQIVIDHRFSMSETLELLAPQIEERLAKTHPADSLLLIMAPNARRFTQPLLLDRQQRQCVFLAPAALYDIADRGGSLSVTAQGFVALLPESHGIALLKNPVSSAARLADLAVATLIKFIRMPLPKPSAQAPVSVVGPGMDLEAWESWLDHYTGTRREDGNLQLLIDGDRFFPRFRQAIAQATNSIHINVYIFDKDDVGVDFADQLKARSKQVDVKVILDRMGSIGGGASPPATPMPEDFVAPSSIVSYLRHDSDVHVHPFLNPWFSSDHAKTIIVDHDVAWLGGMNIGREYRYEWHDLMVEATGPVVGSLETEFKREWAHEGPLGDLAYAAVVLSGPSKPMQAGPGPWMKVRLVPTRTGWKPFASAVLASIRQARQYIYVENPYLFDKRVVLELVKARSRGVDVRVVLPCFNDFKAGGRGNIVIANYFIEHGVRVYFYPGMSHVKALLVDGWACLGSGNLNHLSLRVNHEQNIASSDPVFANEVEQELFEEDFSRSYELKEPVSVDWVDFLADLVLEGF
ncbi:MAG TPA: phosphatidylserine/phosphatidylglycerophosphate/cardiolipin synthase family protein [Verrucomicrobiae bacterium]|nr:phosphatidylserine/phosphatidylglycerophosphate/cardiolipin synthase family protein [Verrucomicrobiae bacterium]